jgi:phytol kinase
LSGLLPSPAVALQAGGLGLVVAALFGASVARLGRRQMRVAYTRKIFHFGIFSVAAAVHAVWDLPGTSSYGTAVALVVLWAVVRGDGNALYEALARESDRPRRSLFIVVPLVTTAVGGLVSALLAGPFATVGYLVAGWGDAVAEPVGSRWGRHRYRVPSLAGVPAERTLEGSAAVLFVGWAAALVGLVALGVGTGPPVLWVAAACASVGALVEAVSHHGTDNLTVQVAASLTALVLAG